MQMGTSCASGMTVTVTTGGTAAAASTADPVCPDGCQAAIDDVYSTCDCADDWEAGKPTMKTMAEGLGCGGAAQAAPLFAAVAAIANHFLN